MAKKPDQPRTRRGATGPPERKSRPAEAAPFESTGNGNAASVPQFTTATQLDSRRSAEIIAAAELVKRRVARQRAEYQAHIIARILDAMGFLARAESIVRRSGIALDQIVEILEEVEEALGGDGRDMWFRYLGARAEFLREKGRH